MIKNKNNNLNLIDIVQEIDQLKDKKIKPLVRSFRLKRFVNNTLNYLA